MADGREVSSHVANDTATTSDAQANHPPEGDGSSIEYVNSRAKQLHETTVFTRRQAEVWSLAEDGYSAAEIADRLGVQVETGLHAPPKHRDNHRGNRDYD